MFGWLYLVQDIGGVDVPGLLDVGNAICIAIGDSTMKRPGRLISVDSRAPLCDGIFGYLTENRLLCGQKIFDAALALRPSETPFRCSCLCCRC